jgi:hypothetical protein
VTTPDPTPSPAWTEHADDLYYAARGLAEHDFHEALNRAGYGLSSTAVETVRLTVALTASATIRTLATAGWVRDEPTVPFEDTGLATAVAHVRPVLEAWENDTATAATVLPTPPN